MAVFDFKGETYFVYHNGSLPGGNGFRRSACITKLNFNEDGSIDSFEESTAGLGGTKVELALADGTLLEHEGFVNSSADADYPMTSVALGSGIGDLPGDSQWVLMEGKEDPENTAYVSIQSENKSGLYLTAKKDGSVFLAQDVSGSDSYASAQTFRTLSGLSDQNGVSVTFESVKFPGRYLTLLDGTLTLTDGSDAAACTFHVNEVE
jgi:hypothetical protein